MNVLFSKQLGHFLNLIRLNSTLSYQDCVKRINIKTCGQLYNDLKNKNKLYKNSPSDGLPVSVDYVDIKPNKYDKTILAIHGVPGYYNHFNKLIEYYLPKNNIRLIVPNLPDFSLTKQTFSFWHSSAERGQFIIDFVKALDIDTIDCLICHSAGLHPIFYILPNQCDLKIKSLGLFCPQPLWLKKSIAIMYRSIGKALQFKLGIKLIESLNLHVIAPKMGYPMSYANADEFLLAIIIPLLSDQKTLHSGIDWLKNNKLPTVFVMGEKDNLIGKKAYFKFLNLIGAKQTSFNYYDANGSLETCDKQSTDWINVLIFRSGGHFAFAKYSNIVNEQIDKIVNNVNKS